MERHLLEDLRIVDNPIHSRSLILYLFLTCFFFILAGTTIAFNTGIILTGLNNFLPRPFRSYLNFLAWPLGSICPHIRLMCEYV